MSPVFSGYYHAGYLRECAGNANDSAYAERKLERNLYQKVTRVVIFAISFRYGSWFIFWHTNSPKPSSLYIPNSQCAYRRNRRTLNRFVGATKAYVFLWLAPSDDHIFATRIRQLVEISLDLSSAPKNHSIAATINLVWFFEKEASRVNAYSCFT